MPTIGTKALALGLAAALAGCSPANPGTSDSAAEASDQTAQAAPDLDGARRLVDAIYTPYTRGESPRLDDIYTDELNRALTGFDGEHEGLGYDPFCQCQDFEDFTYEVRSIEPTDEGVRAKVAISNMGESQVVTILLARQGPEWQVANIGEGADSIYQPESRP